MAYKLKMAERLEDQEKKLGSDLEFGVPDVQLTITSKIIDPFLHTYLSLSLPPVPPLTLDNIFDAVKNVRSWRTLGEHIYSFFLSKLDDIQRRHDSDKACLKAVIELFLGGKGRYGQPSWRAVIWSLYQANEIQLAEHIRSFAEPVQGNEFHY